MRARDSKANRENSFIANANALCTKCKCDMRECIYECTEFTVYLYVYVLNALCGEESNMYAYNSYLRGGKKTNSVKFNNAKHK